jgi:anti-sigma B factor antagonist
MREFRLNTAGPAGDCAVLQVTGEIDVYTAPMLRERIRELAATGTVHLIADLSQVDFLDSTAWESSSAASNGSAKTAAHSPW